MLNKFLLPARTLLDYGLGVPPDTVILCPLCESNPAQIFFNAHPSVRTNQVFPCPTCNHEATYAGTGWYEQQPTSVWKDTDGSDVALDQRGKRMDNPYNNREIDPHGWLKTHKREYKKKLEKDGVL